mmetsp:Transcript_36929/g.86929  ORF Transcript_36929/g.86929 Transcript_36929/m.86929 type:complete len:933 (+) Transcript_36929:129-2927(+)
MADHTPLTIGTKVTVSGKRKGVIKYIGSTSFGPGEWCGVELDKPKGNHDGGVDGQRYFTCKAQHGVYVPTDEVQPLKPWQSAVRVIQSLVRGSRDRQVSQHRKAFMTWNALDLDEEAQHHEQAATQDRVEALLRASHPSVAQLPNEISAVTLAEACGVPTDPMLWGEDMEVESDYEGPHLTFPMTQVQADDLLHHIRSNPDLPLHKKYTAQLLGRCTQLLIDQKMGAVCDAECPPNGKMVIFGDTHGQLADFLLVLQRHGPPSDKVAYLLNGDVADRGDNSVEIFVVVLIYKLLYPNRVFLNRGNHENHDINRKPAEYGGGFYDEVTYKLDGSCFLMFQQFFENLPLVTVLNKQVVVLHGGIPRREGVLLKQITAINRRRQCPKVVQSVEDAILFDLMWADPQDIKGIGLAAQRGPNCRKFGPDITKRFLSDNSLSLCIRSHEVPISLRGFEERHDGRLLTVFSASNYCGQAGNYGAIVVFDSDMAYTLEEHMAPDLDTMIADYLAEQEAQGPRETHTNKEAARARMQKNSSIKESRERMEEEAMTKLEVKICQNKDDLWWYFKNIDKANTGKVTAAKWREGMSAVLKLDVPWFSLQKQLADPDAAGNVDYRNFLDRMRNKGMVEGLKNTNNGWEKQMVVKLYEAILRADFTLKETLAEFDPDGDGVVSPWEFKQALQKCNVDVPEQQIVTLMRLIDRGDGKLDVGSFLDRFQVVYSTAADEGAANVGSQTSGRVRNLLADVGRNLLKRKSRIQVFQDMDTNGDGFISEDEFYSMLDRLQLNGVAQNDKQDMWSYVDVNGDGHLNYLEFCAAFQVVDTMDDGQGGAVSEIVECIVTALQKNMSSLEFAFRFFDQRGAGQVSTQDFKAGLRALNASIRDGGGRSGPLSEDQLNVLVQFVDKDGDGNVDYEEFLSAFKPHATRFEGRGMSRTRS